MVKPIAVVRLKPLVYRIFEVSEMGRAFKFFDSQGEAIRTLWPQGSSAGESTGRGMSKTTGHSPSLNGRSASSPRVCRPHPRTRSRRKVA